MQVERLSPLLICASSCSITIACLSAGHLIMFPGTIMAGRNHPQDTGTSIHLLRSIRIFRVRPILCAHSSTRSVSSRLCMVSALETIIHGPRTLINTRRRVTTAPASHTIIKIPVQCVFETAFRILASSEPNPSSPLCWKTEFLFSD